MSLIRGDQQQQYQQPMPGQMPPQPQQPPTLMERAKKREKWILVWCAIAFAIGVFQVILGQQTMGWVFVNLALNLIGLSALNFIVVPWLQGIFFKSKQASENFFNQRF